MHKVFKMFTVVALASLMLAGCSGGVSENKPISEVKEEAQEMAIDQLKSVVAKYQKALESKKTEIKALKEKLKKIPVVEILGEEAKKIKTDTGDIVTSMKALKARLNIYLRELNRKK